MTLAEAKTSNKNFLTPKDIAEIIGCKEFSIDVQAHEDPTKLGFPVCVIGTRVRIPRVAFLRWMGGDNAD